MQELSRSYFYANGYFQVDDFKKNNKEITLGFCHFKLQDKYNIAHRMEYVYTKNICKEYNKDKKNIGNLSFVVSEIITHKSKKLDVIIYCNHEILFECSYCANLTDETVMRIINIVVNEIVSKDYAFRKDDPKFWQFLYPQYKKDDIRANKVMLPYTQEDYIIAKEERNRINEERNKKSLQKLLKGKYE